MTNLSPVPVSVWGPLGGHA